MYCYTLFKTMFESKTAKSGGVIRRKISNIQKYSSTQLLISYVRKRGFHIIQTGDQYVIFCNPGDIKIIV